VALDDKWGFIDKTGKEVIPLKYDAMEEFSDGMAKVELDGKTLYIDRQGNEYATAVAVEHDFYFIALFTGFVNGLLKRFFIFELLFGASLFIYIRIVFTVNFDTVFNLVST
jgi:hypothetical protein